MTSYNFAHSINKLLEGNKINKVIYISNCSTLEKQLNYIAIKTFFLNRGISFKSSLFLFCNIFKKNTLILIPYTKSSRIDELFTFKKISQKNTVYIIKEEDHPLELLSLPKLNPKSFNENNSKKIHRTLTIKTKTAKPSLKSILGKHLESFLYHWNSYRKMFPDSISSLFRIYDYIIYTRLRNLLNNIENNRNNISTRPLTEKIYTLTNHEVPKNLESNDYRVKISVIVPTIGNINDLKKTLESIKNSNPNSWPDECIVAENNNNQILKNYFNNSTYPFLVKYVYVPTFGLAKAYNYAAKTINQENFIIFLNDDVKVPYSFFSSYRNVINNYISGIYAGGGIKPIYETLPDKKIFEVWPMSSKPFVSVNLKDYSMRFVGLNWGCYASDLKKIGYFNEDLGLGARSNSTGEEVDVQEKLLQLGVQPHFIEEAEVEHFIPKIKNQWKWNYNRSQQNGVSLAIRNKNHYTIIILCIFSILWQSIKFVFMPTMHRSRVIKFRFYFLKGVISGMSFNKLHSAT